METELVEPIVLGELEDTCAEGRGDETSRLDLAHVDHVRVQLTALLGDVEVSLAELMALQPGRVLPLNRGLDEPIVLQLDGKSVATAHLVAVGDFFGVEIVQVL